YRRWTPQSVDVRATASHERPKARSRSAAYISESKYHDADMVRARSSGNFRTQRCGCTSLRDTMILFCPMPLKWAIALCCIVRARDRWKRDLAPELNRHAKQKFAAVALL